ncbi:MAG: CDP-diacylglycerol--glycerol-3-phosphate 3-phosphatidyltransferase [Brevinema sp.]
MIKGFIWNLPNALTIFRLVTVFICTIVILPIGQFSSLRFLICLIFFILGAISDHFDGYFARKLNLVSEWGAYMDPLIDKIFIWALYICFLFIPVLHTPWWAVAVIILRDIIVTFMRKEAIKQNIPFKTSFLAKSKTAIQMLVGVVILCHLWLTYSVVEFYNLGSAERMWSHEVKKIPSYLIMGAAIFTFITLIDYVIAFAKNKKESIA